MREHPFSYGFFVPGLGYKGLRLRRLEHRQFPLGALLIQAQNIEIAVVSFDLEVAIACPRLPVDVFGDLDLAAVQMKPLEGFSKGASFAFDFDL